MTAVYLKYYAEGIQLHLGDFIKSWYSKFKSVIFLAYKNSFSQSGKDMRMCMLWNSSCMPSKIPRETGRNLTQFWHFSKSVYILEMEQEDRVEKQQHSNSLIPIDSSFFLVFFFCLVPFFSSSSCSSFSPAISTDEENEKQNENQWYMKTNVNLTLNIWIQWTFYLLDIVDNRSKCYIDSQLHMSVIFKLIHWFPDTDVCVFLIVSLTWYFTGVSGIFSGTCAGKGWHVPHTCAFVVAWTWKTLIWKIVIKNKLLYIWYPRMRYSWHCIIPFNVAGIKTVCIVLENGPGYAALHVRCWLVSWLVVFMPPDRMIGGILFLSFLFVCLSVCLYVCCQR